MVRDVNSMRDKNGLSYVRKAMVMCGLALNLNGGWEERQLSPELRKIVKKHMNHFEREPVVEGPQERESDVF